MAKNFSCKYYYYYRYVTATSLFGVRRPLFTCSSSRIVTPSGYAAAAAKGFAATATTPVACKTYLPFRKWPCDDLDDVVVYLSLSAIHVERPTILTHIPTPCYNPLMVNPVHPSVFDYGSFFYYFFFFII